VKEVPPCKL
jgi:hypothetical protein